MKRYTREDMGDEAKMAILSKIGTVIEIVGNTARIGIPSQLVDGVPHVIEVSTNYWCELIPDEAASS